MASTRDTEFQAMQDEADQLLQDKKFTRAAELYTKLIEQADKSKKSTADLYSGRAQARSSSYFECLEIKADKTAAEFKKLADEDYEKIKELAPDDAMAIIGMCLMLSQEVFSSTKSFIFTGGNYYWGKRPKVKTESKTNETTPLDEKKASPNVQASSASALNHSLFLQFIKRAEGFINENLFSKAIDCCNYIINAESNPLAMRTNALYVRALAHQLNGSGDLASSDYDKILGLNPSDRDTVTIHKKAVLIFSRLALKKMSNFKVKTLTNIEIFQQLMDANRFLFRLETSKEDIDVTMIEPSQLVGNPEATFLWGSSYYLKHLLVSDLKRKQEYLHAANRWMTSAINGCEEPCARDMFSLAQVMDLQGDKEFAFCDVIRALLNPKDTISQRDKTLRTEWLNEWESVSLLDECKAKATTPNSRMLLQRAKLRTKKSRSEVFDYAFAFWLVDESELQDKKLLGEIFTGIMNCLFANCIPSINKGELQEFSFFRAALVRVLERAVDWKLCLPATAGMTKHRNQAFAECLRATAQNSYTLDVQEDKYVDLIAALVKVGTPYLKKNNLKDFIGLFDCCFGKTLIKHAQSIKSFDPLKAKDCFDLAMKISPEDLKPRVALLRDAEALLTPFFEKLFAEDAREATQSLAKNTKKKKKKSAKKTLPTIQEQPANPVEEPVIASESLLSSPVISVATIMLDEKKQDVIIPVPEIKPQKILKAAQEVEYPDVVCDVFQRLERVGVSRSYVVGGFLRDYVLKKQSNDFDFVVGTKQNLYGQLLKAFPESEFPDVDISEIRGISRQNTNAEQKEEYRCLGFIVKLPNRMKLDFVLSESLSHMEFEFDALEKDARGRDFTANALYGSKPKKGSKIGEIFDPLGTGYDHVKRKLLKSIKETKLTLKDDPSRALRAINFKNQGWKWSEAIEREIMMVEPADISAKMLNQALIGRTNCLLLKLLCNGHAAANFYDLWKFGLLTKLEINFGKLLDVKETSGIIFGQLHDVDRLCNKADEADQKMFLNRTFLFWAKFIADRNKISVDDVLKQTVLLRVHVETKMKKNKEDCLKWVDENYGQVFSWGISAASHGFFSGKKGRLDVNRASSRFER